MNSVIVVAYTGIKPAEAEIDAMAECLMRLKCCKKVEVVKHYDKDSIVDVIGKSATAISFESKEECKQYDIIPAIHNACYNAKHYILNI